MLDIAKLRELLGLDADVVADDVLKGIVGFHDSEISKATDNNKRKYDEQVASLKSSHTEELEKVRKEVSAAGSSKLDELYEMLKNNQATAAKSEYEVLIKDKPEAWVKAIEAHSEDVAARVAYANGEAMTGMLAALTDAKPIPGTGDEDLNGKGKDGGAGASADIKKLIAKGGKELEDFLASATKEQEAEVMAIMTAELE